MALVDVVIPVHGHWPLTERCLASLFALRGEGIARVIVVDDASPDDTVDRLRARNDVEAVALSDNRGFAAACNEGARRASAPYVLFLNNDAFPRTGSIRAMLSAFDDAPVAAAGPLLLNGDGSVQSFGLAKTRGRASNFERVYAYLDPSLPQLSCAYDAAALSGAALMVRREAFESAGRFDERFRNGLEDVDLSLRLLAAGRSLRCVPQAVLEHLEGASRGKAAADDANARVFDGIWQAALPELPVLEEPRLPVIDIRWLSADAADRGAAALWRETLNAHAGATDVWNAPFPAHVRAVLERRPRVIVRGGACPPHPIPRAIRMCAPQTAREARREHALDAAQYWAASEACAALLREAGCDELLVVRLGVPEGQTGAEMRHAAGRWASGLADLVAGEGAADEEELRRRLPDVYAGRRVRELARAFVYGVPPVERFAISPRARDSRPQNAE